MLGLDFTDEDLVKSFSNVTSMLLPHSKYNASNFSSILRLVDRFITVEEMSPEFRVLYSTLGQLRLIAVSGDQGDILLPRELYDDLLQTGLSDFIISYSNELSPWFSSRGVSLNLEIVESVELAISHLYSACIDLYDRCFALEIPSSEYVNYILSLRNSFEQNAMRACINNQVTIIQTSLRIGRKVYRGAEDCRNYVASTLKEITRRLDDTQNANISKVDSVASSVRYREEGASLSIPIMNYRIPPMDKTTPMFRHRLIVLAAKENVGKTVMAIDQSANALVEGRRVLFMYGESPESLIYFKIVSSYIRKKYGKFVTASQVRDSSNCPDHVFRLIQMAESEITSSGNLLFIDSLTYSDVYIELEDYYEDTKFDMLVIDHVGALNRSYIDSRRTIKDCLDDMSIQLRRFKKKYPVSIVALSHLSSEAEKEIAKGGKAFTSPTRDSSVLPKEADEVFVLTDSEEMLKRNIRALQIYKMRDAAKITDLIYLDFQFNVYHMDYRTGSQVGEGNSMESTAHEKLLMDSYTDDIVSEETDGIAFDDDIEVELDLD